MTDKILFLAQAGSGGGQLFLPMILAMFGLMYFLMIRPQRQEQKRQNEMRDNLSRNDRVVSIGGIHGIVTGITNTTVTVKVSDGVSMKFDKTAVARVESTKSDSDSKSSDKEAEDEEE